MRAKFHIGHLEVIIDATKIDFNESKAQFFAIKEDDEYTFEAISCAARPMEFSIVNQLYALDHQKVKDLCDYCNKTKELGVLSTNNYHLIVSPFVERYTYFGEEQAEQLTNEVIDICKKLDLNSLRITQFCMLRHDTMPIYPQFKGILKALTSRLDSNVSVVFFDIPEDHFYELKILFESYQTPS